MTGIDASTDRAARHLLAEAAIGNAAALEAMIARFNDDLTRVCVVICVGDADLAADAVQSAWAIVWQKIGTLRNPDRLRPWLVSIAANQARQVMRRQRRQGVVEISLADVGSSRGDPAREPSLTDLGAALRRLGPDERALLALRYVADLDSGQIGEALGLSASGVRSRLERLLTRLRLEIDDA